MENRLSAVLAAREAEGRQMASLFEPDVPEVVSGEDVTQAEQPQQPVSPAINDKKSDSGVNVPAGGIEQELKMKPEEEMEQQLPPGISESVKWWIWPLMRHGNRKIIRTSSSRCSVVKR